jgi:hypothetical protein
VIRSLTLESESHLPQLKNHVSNVVRYIQFAFLVLLKLSANGVSLVMAED